MSTSVPIASVRSISFEKFNREEKDLRFYGIGEIDDIRGVDDEAGNIVLAHPFLCLWDAELIHRFTSGVLRRAGIKHKGIGSVGKAFPGRNRPS